MIARHHCRNCERPIVREKLYDGPDAPHMPAHLTIHACQCDHADQIVGTYESEKHTRLTHYDEYALSAGHSWLSFSPISYCADRRTIELATPIEQDNQFAANHFAGMVVML